jgi:SAM-dependent methyltransferase
MNPTRYGDVLDQLRTAYDAGAERRDSMAKPPWKLAERSAFLARIRDEGGRRLLEVGAGTGQDSAYFQENGLAVTAVDLSPAMVERCRAKGIDAHVMDFLHLDFPAASFDAVFAFNCLLHVPNADLPAVLAAIRDVLRPGGLLFVGVYGGDGTEGVEGNDWHEPPRFFSWRTDAQLRAAAGQHFDIVDFHVVEQGGHRFQSLTLRRSRADQGR